MSNDVSLAVATAVLGLLTAGVLALINNWINVRAGVDEDLRTRRLAHYPALWKATAAVSRWPRAEVNRGTLENLHRMFRSWYYEKGGLFLSEQARARYGDVQELIEALLAADRGNATDMLTTSRYDDLMETASALRSALTQDLDTRRRRSAWENRRRSRWHAAAAQAAKSRINSATARGSTLWRPEASQGLRGNLTQLCSSLEATGSQGGAISERSQPDTPITTAWYGRIEDQDLELWKHYANFGGEDKNRMVTIATWLLGFSAAALSYIAVQLFEPTVRHFNKPSTAAVVSAFGVILSLYAGYISVLYGGYSNRNWQKADDIAVGRGWMDLLPSNDKLQARSINALAWRLARPCKPRENLAPVFRVFITLAAFSGLAQSVILITSLTQL